MFMITRGSCVVRLRKSQDNKYTYDFVSCTWIIDDVFFCSASSCKNNFLSFTFYTLPGVLKSIGSRILGIASFHIFPPIWNYKFCLGRSNPWLFHDFELIINQLAIWSKASKQITFWFHNIRCLSFEIIGWHWLHLFNSFFLNCVIFCCASLFVEYQIILCPAYSQDWRNNFHQNQNRSQFEVSKIQGKRFSFLWIVNNLSHSSVTFHHWHDIYEFYIP